MFLAQAIPSAGQNPNANALTVSLGAAALRNDANGASAALVPDAVQNFRSALQRFSGSKAEVTVRTEHLGNALATSADSTITDTVDGSVLPFCLVFANRANREDPSDLGWAGQSAEQQTAANKVPDADATSLGDELQADLAVELESRYGHAEQAADDDFGESERTLSATHARTDEARDKDKSSHTAERRGESAAADPIPANENSGTAVTVLQSFPEMTVTSEKRPELEVGASLGTEPARIAFGMRSANGGRAGYASPLTSLDKAPPDVFPLDSHRYAEPLVAGAGLSGLPETVGNAQGSNQAQHRTRNERPSFGEAKGLNVETFASPGAGTSIAARDYMNGLMPRAVSAPVAASISTPEGNAVSIATAPVMSPQSVMVQAAPAAAPVQAKAAQQERTQAAPVSNANTDVPDGAGYITGQERPAFGLVSKEHSKPGSSSRTSAFREIEDARQASAAVSAPLTTEVQKHTAATQLTTAPDAPSHSVSSVPLHGTDTRRGSQLEGSGTPLISSRSFEAPAETKGRHLEFTTRDGSMGLLHIRASLNRIGDLDVGVSASNEQSREALRDIAPVLHASLLEQVEAKGGTAALHVFNTTSPSLRQGFDHSGFAGSDGGRPSADSPHHPLKRQPRSEAVSFASRKDTSTVGHASIASFVASPQQSMYRGAISVRI